MAVPAPRDLPSISRERAAGAAVRPLSALGWRDVAISALLAACALALYVRTLAPGLVLGDGAEFQTLATTLGLGHPTGYPIYLLLGKLFTLLPLGSVAYRVNLLSAAGGAGALALIYLVGRSLGCRRGAALVGPLALGLCALFWWHAVMAEIYTVGAAFMAGVLLLVLRWRHTGAWGYLFGAGLLGGMSLGVHTTVALAAPAALVYLALTARRRADWLAAAAGAGVGLALFAAAFLLMDMRDAPASFYNSTVRPWLSRWGMYPAGFDTPLQRIAFEVSAREFGWAMRAPGRGELVARSELYWQFLHAGWPSLAVGLGVLGLAATLARGSDRTGATWREGLLLGLIWCATMGFVLSYGVRDIFVFYIPTYVPLAILASLGAAAVIDMFGALLARRVAARQVALLCGGVAAIAPLAVIAPSFHEIRDSARAGRITFLDTTDFARYPYPVFDPQGPHDYAVRLAARIEDDAIVFTDWGRVFTLYYVAHVEQGRAGIAVHEWFPQNDDPAANISVIRSIDANLVRRPVYFTYIPQSLRGLYRFEQEPGAPNLFRVAGRK